VTPSAATGNVTFRDGTVTVGIGTIVAGSATLTTSILSIGSHTLTAIYSGDASYLSATSASRSQTVNVSPWALTGWSDRKAVTVSKRNVTADLSNFPLLVRVTNDINLGTIASSTGADIRFTTGTGVLLPFETESFTVGHGSGSGLFWVKAPLISSLQSTTIYLYYGKSGVADGQNRTEVWDSNFKGVWHLSGSTLSMIDSTGNANNGTNYGATAVTGQVGGSASFNGSSYIQSPFDASTLSGIYTLSLWGKLNNVGTVQSLLTCGGSQIVNVTGTDWRWQVGDSTGTAIRSNTSRSNNTWNYYTVTSTGITAGLTKLYTNSSQQDDTHVIGGINGLVYFGKYGGIRWVTGVMDEVRISSVARSAPWIAFEYQNMGSSSGETILGAQEGKTYTTTALTSTHNPVAFGSGFVLRATVSSASAGGMMTFKEGIVPLGSIAVSSGIANLSINNLSVGTHNVTAEYSGDSNYLASTSLILAQTVSKASTTTALSANPNPSTLGQSVTLTASVVPFSATGTITFIDSGRTVGTGTIVAGSATITTTILSLGSHSITAQYSGNQSYLTSTSSPWSQTVDVPAWNLTDWSDRKAITVSRTNVASDLQNFPLLVRVTNDTDVGVIASSTGKDIRFSTSTGVLLPFETESFTVGHGSGSGLFWVKVPTVSSIQNTTIYLYYGNPAATDGQSRTAVWDSNFKGVWHLNEATDATVYDSTSYANNSINQTWTQSAGKINGAGNYNGTSNKINFGNNASLRFTGSFTASTWIKGTDDTGRVIGGNTWYMTITSFSSQKIYLYVYNTSNGYGAYRRIATDINDNSWHYVTGVYNSTAQTIDMYRDGVLSNGTLTGTIPSSLVSSSADITTGYDGAGNGYLSAAVDENRLSSTARSADWIRFEYLNMGGTGSGEVMTAAQEGLRPSSLAIATSGTPAIFGNTVTFTATVTPSTGTGTVTFVEGSTIIGTAELGSGSGTIALSDLSPGTHTIHAEYPGNSQFLSSISSSITQRIYIPVSGTLMGSNGTSPLSGKKISLSINGGPVAGSGTTNGSGIFSVAVPVSMTGGSIITVFSDNNAEKAVTVIVGANGTMTGVTLIQNALITKSAFASVTNRNLAIARLSNSADADIAQIIADATLSSATISGKVIVWTGSTLRPLGTLSAGSGLMISGTLAMDAYTLSVGGELNARHGTLQTTGLVKLSSASGTYAVDTGSNHLKDLTVTTPNASLDTGLGAYWNFETLASGKVRDGSGNANTGSIIGSPTLSSDVPTVSFPDSKSMAFNGTTDAVSVPDSTSYNAADGTFAISVWIKPDAGDRMILSKLDTENQNGGYQLRLSGTNTIILDTYDSSGIRKYLDTSISPTLLSCSSAFDGKWYDPNCASSGSWLSSWDRETIAEGAVAFTGLRSDLTYVAQVYGYGDYSQDADIKWRFNGSGSYATAVLPADIATWQTLGSFTGVSGRTITIANPGQTVIGVDSLLQSVRVVAKSSVSGTIGINQWHHIAVKYDGSMLKLFVDGVLQGSTPFSNGRIDAAQPLLIGGSSSRFSGLMDELRIYTNALSDADVQTLAGGFAPTGLSPTFTFIAPVTIDGNLLIEAGKLSAGNQLLDLHGNWTNISGAASFIPGSSTVTLSGTNQTLSGSTTFWNLAKSVSSADTLTLAGSSQFSINGSLTLTGISGNLLSLRSTSTGIASQLILDPAGSQTLEYLNVRDSDASSGQTLECLVLTAGCVNFGNNAGWTFQVGSSVTLAVDTNPSVFGSSITLTATVIAGATGTVTFMDGVLPLGTATINGTTAMYPMSDLPVGDHSITARYNGDTVYGMSTSDPIVQTVRKIPTTLSFVSSVNPSVSGRSVLLTATVMSGATVMHSATGTIMVRDGAETLGSVVVSHGSGSFSTTTLAIGSHSLTAQYSGNRDFVASTSSVLLQTVDVMHSTFIAQPEGRGTGCGSTLLTYEVRLPGTQTIIGSGSLTSDTDGRAIVSFDRLLEGSIYDFTVKGLSHLRRKTAEVTFNSGMTIDFTDNSANPLKAGDVDPSHNDNGDNNVNILDLNRLLGGFGGGQPKIDLTRDGEVNLLDLNITLTNYGLTGDE
ncbi:MAG: DUF2341 domain-containing protein, partial [Candidatus Peregrinibacteria bacterium]